MEETADIIDLNGEFRFKVDSKGRVSLPAKFRKALPSDLVVTPDPEGSYLMVFTSTDFNGWVKSLITASLGEFDAANREHLAARRALKSRADDVQIDTAGRITVPADQLAKAGIEKDVVIIGNTGYFEIWDAKRYETISEKFDVASLLK